MDVTTETHFPSDQPADLVLTTDTKYFLHTAARWANFIAIIGFIGAGLIVLCALIMLVSGTATMSQAGGMSAILGTIGAGGIAVFYLLIAVFYFFFAYYLFRFASSAKKAVLFNNGLEMSKSIESLKSFFKLWGITTIIAIALGIICFIGAIIIAASMANAMH